MCGRGMLGPLFCQQQQEEEEDMRLLIRRILGGQLWVQVTRVKLVHVSACGPSF